MQNYTTSFPFWVEIKIQVAADYQREEKQTRHYPGCPAHCEITDIEIVHDGSDKVFENLKELNDYILKHYYEAMQEEAWEHL